MMGLTKAKVLLRKERASAIEVGRAESGSVETVGFVVVYHCYIVFVARRISVLTSYSVF